MAVKKIMQSNNGIRGTLHVPGDKSISHRAVMLGSLAHGQTIIEGFLMGEDCLHTIDCFKDLGVPIEIEKDKVLIEGKGFNGLQKADKQLYVGNSGTTIRLVLGILATLPFSTTITGDASIAKRPMDRVVNPLSKMGATFSANKTPITVAGTSTKAIAYDSPIASAQVKSSLLLAALNSEGISQISEPLQSRDHTERMLTHFNIEWDKNENSIFIKGKQHFSGKTIKVPGDISSAAFFLAAAVITPNSRVECHNIGLNPTRTGIIKVLQEMGASVETKDIKNVNGEPVGTVVAEYSPDLKGVVIEGEDIPRLIDELPIISLVATQASGITVIKDAMELKVKETNRISVVASQLNKCGASIEETEDGMIITGGTELHHETVCSHGDHRIGMMLAIAGCVAKGGVSIDNASAVSVSYPTFFEDLNNVIQ
jgi:3-phosphoshikimate 1-carboxyvinyltransferase